MSDKYGVLQDKYCYPSTDVLVNLLYLEDPVLLSDAKAEFTTLRYQTYISSIRSIEAFTFSHVHDLYWSCLSTSDAAGTSLMLSLPLALRQYP